MAAFMGENPNAGGEEALDEGVDAPEGGTDGHGWNIFGGEVGVEQVEGGGEAGDVSEHVRQRPEGGALEAVLWDGIEDLLDGVVGHLEHVTVSVNEFAKLRFWFGLGQRRERCRRCRVMG